WNSIGTAVLYTSQSRALCAVEVAVHIPLGIIPEDYHLLSIQIPDDSDLFKNIDPNELPFDWKINPPSFSTQQFGDQFVAENKYLILMVPSVVVQGDFNYLLNPAHPNFREIEIISGELFEFDKRLLS
ncbi:MAG: RES family NAD+ phosphorylase, partial [Balneolaceae bacterium]